jgi:HK97 gp10 family phage protein
MALRNWRGDDIANRYAGIFVTRMDKAGAMLEAEVKRKLGQGGGARTGVLYPGARSISSAPGEPPAYQSGVLQGGVTHRTERRGLKITGYVGVASVHYARMLEFGTSRMAARPFLRPGIRENAGRIRSILAGR